MKAFRPLLLLLLPCCRAPAKRTTVRIPRSGPSPRKGHNGNPYELRTRPCLPPQKGSSRNVGSFGGDHRGVSFRAGLRKGGACPSRADRQPSGRRSRTPLHDGAGALPHTGCLRGRSADLQPRIRDSRGLGAGRCRPRGLLDPGPALRLSGMAPPFRGKSKGSTSNRDTKPAFGSAPRPVTTNRPTTIRYTTT